MGEDNSLNVFKGPDSVRKYFDPDSAPPLPLVEIPDCLNPYRGDGVRIYAKMMSMHPANNVKCMPALNLENSVVPGQTKTVVEYSSGSTVLSMSLIARAFYNLLDVRAFLSNKTSLAKIRLMQLFGINITLFGGPSQPEPLDERGGIRAAKRMAEESSSAINPNQYENDNNWKSHVKWTGPQILRQLPEINVICAAMGTSGTMTGLSTYFKEAKPSVFRLGVCTAARDRALLGPVEFPWRSAVDQIEEVGSHDSYSLSLDLIRQGIVCGPSSGFNLQGLFQFVEKRKKEGSLAQLAGSDGEIHCAFLFCDLPYQYINEYFDKLGDSFFSPIVNELTLPQELLGVDSYRYDEKWERSAEDALKEFFGLDSASIDELHRLAPSLTYANSTKLKDLLRSQPQTAVIDLRQPTDFNHFHLPGSVNLPRVQPAAYGPFQDPHVLKALWLRLDDTFTTPSPHLLSILQGKRLLVLCYDGDSSRVATSVLRAKGYDADSVKGGFDVLSGTRKVSHMTGEQARLKSFFEEERLAPAPTSHINAVAQSASV